MLPFGAAIANHNMLYWVLPHPKPFKNPGNSRQRAVNDSGKMAMCQGCAERQCGGVRGCLRSPSLCMEGIVELRARRHRPAQQRWFSPGFWWFFGCLGHWDPTSHQDFRHSLDSLILQYWFIRTFIQLWLPGARSHQTLECFHVFRARLQIVVPNSTQRFPENKDSHPQLQLFLKLP